MPGRLILLYTVLNDSTLPALGMNDTTQIKLDSAISRFNPVSLVDADFEFTFTCFLKLHAFVSLSQPSCRVSGNLL